VPANTISSLLVVNIVSFFAFTFVEISINVCIHYCINTVEFMNIDCMCVFTFLVLCVVFMK